MEFFIVTGMSGAGKSRAIKTLEDIGFYCIDNMPPALIPRFAEIFGGEDSEIDKVAIVTDVRGAAMFPKIFDSLEELKQNGLSFKILFFDATDSVLVNRYKETRRRHPLSERFGGSVTKAIEYERGLLRSIREKADVVIDTTNYSPGELNDRLIDMFVKGRKNSMTINVVSFGFKYGLPADADLVFDVRCLPNPYYIADLKPHTGLEAPVYDYVFSFPQTREFLNKLCDMIAFLIPHYVEERKPQLTIAIGCTGGRHRSVAIAEALHKYINTNIEHSIINHRDIHRD